GKAWRHQASTAAGGAIPPAPRLADVVRGDVLTHVPRVVRAVPRQAAPSRPADAGALAKRSLRRKVAAFRARAPLPLPLHDADGAPRDRCVVAPRAGRRLRSAGLASRGWFVMRHRIPLVGVLFLVLLASCAVPRPTVGLTIAGTHVAGSREGSFCQTGGCRRHRPARAPPVAPLTAVRAAPPLRLALSGGA